MTLDIEGVLAGHEWKYETAARGSDRFVILCECGDRLIPSLSSAVATLDDHRAHVAAVLREQIAAAQAEACRCSVRARDVDVSELYDDEDAAQVAPSRVPVEGS